MGLFSRKDPEKLAYKREVVTATIHGESARPDDPATEYMKDLQKLSYLTVDELVANWLMNNPQFHALIAPAAPVNRTTWLSKKQAEIAYLDLKILISMMKLTMDPDVYEAGGMEMLQSIEMFIINIINDAVEGRKLLACTVVSKQIAITTDQKKGLFSR